MSNDELDRMQRLFPDFTRAELSAILTRWSLTVRKNCCPEWKDPEQFVSFCQEAGYESGCFILREDDSLPFSPENCLLDFSRTRDLRNLTGWYRCFVDNWNKCIYLPNREKVAAYRSMEK